MPSPPFHIIFGIALHYLSIINMIYHTPAIVIRDIILLLYRHMVVRNLISFELT
jgi:hypothetical protein